MRAISNRHIPSEIVEEILLNLPVKSLLRFSSVSKLWNSTIFESDFVKRYRSRSRAGRERIALVRSGNVIMEKASSCLISSISSNNSTVDDATDFDCPFASRYDDQYTIVASCDDLWLARSRSLFLWNPSMGTYKKVPYHSSFMGFLKEVDFIFGLGYECVGDDYKILRISLISRTTRVFRAELYSLRSDSWRYIKDIPTNIGTNYGDCAFVSGKLHLNPASYAPPPAITCFDLLTEKFGEVALPNYSLESRHIMHVTVLRGILCVSINYLQKYCEIWVMEEYGVAESWTKKFTISYFNNSVSSIRAQILPLYLYDNGEILIRFFDGRKVGSMFVYNEDEKSRKEVKINVNCSDNKIACRFVYVDSLVAPEMQCESKHELKKLSTSKILPKHDEEAAYVDSVLSILLFYGSSLLTTILVLHRKPLWLIVCLSLCLVYFIMS